MQTAAQQKPAGPVSDENKGPLGAWFARHSSALGQELARAAGVAESQVSRWRNGQIPTIHMLAIERWTSEIDPSDPVTARDWAEYAEQKAAARRK